MYVISQKIFFPFEGVNNSGMVQVKYIFKIQRGKKAANLNQGSADWRTHPTVKRNPAN